jgi:hypothetical protein
MFLSVNSHGVELSFKWQLDVQSKYHEQKEYGSVQEDPLSTVQGL